MTTAQYTCARLKCVVKQHGMKLLYCLAWTGFLACGCAVYHIKPIPRDQADVKNWGKSGEDGYIIYQPELYFLVTIDPPAKTAAATTQGKATATVKPVFLPNYNKPYRVTCRSFLAKSDFTFNFEDGLKLTSISDKSDSSGVATAIAGQLSGALSAISKFAGTRFDGSDEKTSKSQVVLLKPVYDSSGSGKITGFVPVEVPASLKE